MLGAGAIGSSVGADLTEAGEDVVLIDQWPAHVEAMRTDGLRVVMPDREVNEKVRALHLGELATERPAFDVVLLAAKSYDTVWMCHLIEPHLADDGVFVGLQNGMNEEMITPIVGSERTVACVVELSAEIWEPGLVQRDTTREGTWFAVGELDGAVTDRVGEVAGLLRHSARCRRDRQHLWRQVVQARRQLDDHGPLHAARAEELGGLRVTRDDRDLGAARTGVGGGRERGSDTGWSRSSG